jgi:hypothetical protein
MKLNTKLTKLASGILAVGGLLMASQANAATISVIPTSNSIAVGDTVGLTVHGDFSGESTTLGGGVLLSWDSAQLQLIDDIATTTAAINASLVANTWTPVNPDGSSVVVTANSVSVDVFDFSFTKSVFDIFSLTLVAVPPPSSGTLAITASAISALTGGWEARPVDYIGASITTGAVPVPPAVWLFGSGLIGLVGIARRRSPQLA